MIQMVIILILSVMIGMRSIILIAPRVIRNGTQVNAALPLVVSCRETGRRDDRRLLIPTRQRERTITMSTDAAGMRTTTVPTLIHIFRVKLKIYFCFNTIH